MADFHSGGRAVHHWLDVFATSRPPRGGSHEKTAALPYPHVGEQKGHCGVHVRTQGSPQGRHTGTGAYTAQKPLCAPMK